MTTRVFHLAAAAAAAAAVLGLVRPAAAQRAGTVELDAFARFTNFDNSLPLNNTVGVGGRATVYLNPRLTFELDLSRTSSRSETYTPVHARLVGGFPTGARVEALLGGGFVRNAYRGPLDASDAGLSGIVAVRYHLNRRVWLRLGADFDIMFHTASDSPFSFYNGNWGLHFGVGARLNGGEGAGTQ